MYAYGYVHVSWIPEALVPLELGLQASIGETVGGRFHLATHASCLSGVLGTERGSFARAVSVLNRKAISPVPKCVF